MHRLPVFRPIHFARVFAAALTLFPTTAAAVRAAPPEGPTAVTFVNTTPPESLVAGQPFNAFEITISHADGPVPGTYCASAVITDILPQGAYATPAPAVIVTAADGAALDTIPMGESFQLCFIDGRAIVRALLYYAPPDKPLHRLYVEMGGLQASTEPFVLLPAAAFRTVIVGADGEPVADSVTLESPDGTLIMYAPSYDPMGNPRGHEYFTVTTTGTLHPINDSDGVVNRLYYDVSLVQYDEEGWLYVTLVDTTYGRIADSVYVRIVAPATALTHALTRDRDADGYIDAIELTFSRSVSIDPQIADRFRVEHNSYSLTPTSITGRDGWQSDSVFILSIEELTTTAGLQTGWRPYISFSGLPGITDVSAGTVVCADGAGPVISSVVKLVTDAADRTQDRVVVTFSERVLSMNGSRLMLIELPADLFFVFARETDGSFTRVSGMFEGIENLVSVVADSVVTFAMTNGSNLTGSHYLSIAGGLIDDSNGMNEPAADNRKVRVQVAGNIPSRIAVAPANIYPCTRFVAPGDFSASHEPQAGRWVEMEECGAKFTFPVAIPEESMDQAVEVTVEINLGKDMIQNSTVADFLGNLDSRGIDYRGSSFVMADVYWNGYGRDGSGAEQFDYTVEVNVRYDDPNMRDVRMTATAKVGEGGTPPGCGCGSGAGLAFIPPVGLRLSRLLKKRRRPQV